jgi:hypothetical protein
MYRISKRDCQEKNDMTVEKQSTIFLAGKREMRAWGQKKWLERSKARAKPAKKS